MRDFGLSLLALVILLHLPLSAHADIYKWVGENGSVSFSDTPPPAGKQVTIVETKHAGIAEDQPPAGAGAEAVRQETGPSEQVVKDQQKKGDTAASSTKPGKFPEVELYVTSWCGYCKKAQAFLTSRGVPYQVYDIERDSEAAQRMTRLNGRGGVPVAVIDGKTLVGFSPPAYAQALGL